MIDPVTVKETVCLIFELHSFVVDTKTILNSEMKTIFNSLRIIGVKTHWIFAQV